MILNILNIIKSFLAFLKNKNEVVTLDDALDFQVKQVNPKFEKKILEKLLALFVKAIRGEINPSPVIFSKKLINKIAGIQKHEVRLSELNVKMVDVDRKANNIYLLTKVIFVLEKDGSFDSFEKECMYFIDQNKILLYDIN